MSKFVFITGGVVSSLGKGLTSASIGMLFRSHGLNVEMLKMDPYLNVDPGLICPLQHGEVYLLEDGAETDLDLGHYERFVGKPMHQLNSVSSGKIYMDTLSRESQGDFDGGTVQVVPHITNAIKSAGSSWKNRAWTSSWSNWAAPLVTWKVCRSSRQCGNSSWNGRTATSRSFT